MKQRVAILGASDRPDRYAHMAFRLLRQYGHEAIPVSPKLKDLEGVPVYARLADVPGEIDTLTMYVGPAVSSALTAEIVARRPGRVIFNPGSENPSLAKALKEAGIRSFPACTLVLLRTNQFAGA